MAKTKWHSLPAKDVLERVNSTSDGLTENEVAKRLAEFGPNSLPEAKPPSLLERIINQLNDFLVLLLIAASAVSLAVGEVVDAVVILAIVVLNAVLGVIQESKAEQALQGLKKLAAPRTTVVRDGRAKGIPAKELVPGDIVRLAAGDNVPADIRLLETANLKVDESALTGESVPADKNAHVVLDEEVSLADRTNSVFMGTAAAYGRALGVVTATGTNTEIGQIAAMLESYGMEKTHLQKRLEVLGRKLGILVLLIAGTIFLLGLLRAEPLLGIFLTAISLAVAAVPEGLPAVVTIVLALGMKRMIKRNAIVRRLSAVETLGSTTVIASDKTGTLTQNEMTVVRLFVTGKTIAVTGRGYKSEGQFRDENGVIDVNQEENVARLLKYAALNTDADLVSGDDRYTIVGDPTEGALVVAAAKAGYDRGDLNAKHPRLAEVPFDSERKRMTTIHEMGSHYVAITKGAPDVVLNLCTRIRGEEGERPLEEHDREAILAKNEEFADKALRILAVASREIDTAPKETPKAEDVEQDLTFLGLLAMQDPVRKDAVTAVNTAKKAGIRTVMITGDFKKTALAIARELGLPAKRCLTGIEIQKLSDEELTEEVKEVSVFARVSPQDKVRIVEALKRLDNIVAVTGDGVNDSLALKTADIGVAMGITGTDVAKGTADMILTDDNFASIVAAVREGRVIFSNIRKFVYFLISCNSGEVLLIFLAMVLGLPIPLTPVLLLWLNLVTDSLPALALGMEPGDPGVMNDKPRDKQEPILHRPLQIGVLTQSIAITAATLGTFVYALNQPGVSLVTARTMAFVTLVAGELWRAHTSRSYDNTLREIGLFRNQSMLWATLISAVLLIAVVTVPPLRVIFETTSLSVVQWAVALGLSLIPAVVAEVQKTLARAL